MVVLPPLLSLLLSLIIRSSISINDDDYWDFIIVQASLVMIIEI